MVHWCSLKKEKKQLAPLSNPAMLIFLCSTLLPPPKKIEQQLEALIPTRNEISSHK